ncbi:MAG: hypothetical protein ACREHV_11110 [Rhizomicrobium sp.]
MPRYWILGGFLIAGAAAIGAVSIGLIGFGAASRTCSIDNEIAPADRAAIGKAALTFAQALLGPQPGAARAFLSDETRRAVPGNALASGVVPLFRQFGAFRDIRISHIWFIHAKAGGAETRVICGSGNESVAVAAKPGTSQAHVLVAAATRNNDWALTAWLLPQRDGWRVRYFHLNLSATAGRSAADLLELASHQRAAGNAFNAALLYADAAAISYRDRYFQMGLAQTLLADEAKFRLPPELRGRPPFEWKLSGAEFAVSNVTIIGVGRELGLVFTLPEQAWLDDEEADRENRAFLAGFMATHRTFSRVFEFLVARALRPDGSGGFGTVYEVGKGYRS